MEQTIKEFMYLYLSENSDTTIEELAEAAIDKLAGDNWEEWLSETHPVWDLAAMVYLNNPSLSNVFYQY